MRKRFLKTMFMVLVLMCSLSSICVSAEASDGYDDIKIDGRTEMTFESIEGKVVVTPSSIFTDTDLFSSFKNLMPGDVKTEEIHIKNRCSGKQDIIIFLKAKTEDDGKKGARDIDQISGETVHSMTEFLDKLNVKVWVNEKAYYAGTANFEFSEDQQLVMVPWQQDATVRVQLSVPLSLNNVYSARLGQINWYFTTVDRQEYMWEVFGIIIGDYIPPEWRHKVDHLIQTGQIKWPIGLLIGAGLILIVIGVKKKKKNEKE